MSFLIFPSKICTNKCALDRAKYGVPAAQRALQWGCVQVCAQAGAPAWGKACCLFGGPVPGPQPRCPGSAGLATEDTAARRRTPAPWRCCCGGGDSY